MGRPSARAEADGSLTIWLAVGGHVVRVHATQTESGLAATMEDEAALVSTEAWEAGAVGDPSVAGLVMAYTGGDGAGIGLATSADGFSFTSAPSPALVPVEPWEAGHVASPSLVVEPDLGRRLLFYVGGHGAGVGVASSIDGGATFTRLASGPVLAPSPAAKPAPFDVKPFTSASVVRRATPLERTVYELWYSVDGVLATASSFDGLTFSRFPLNPVLVDSGFDLAGPFRMDGVLLHVRNVSKGTAKKGRGLGVALFGSPD